MSVARRRRIQTPSGHDGPDERWMASYLDMVTVLMCMFIVLFAMSTVDQAKFEALRASLATGFGTEASAGTDATEGVVVPPDMLDDEGEGFFEPPTGPDPAATEPALPDDPAQAEYDDLDQLRERLRGALDAQGLGDAVTFTIDERGLTVGLISAETFFATNSADLSDRARAVLDATGAVLATDSRQISVEGHADHRQPSGAYADNWALSTARAEGVQRYLIDVRALGADRTAAVGYGASRPLAEGESSEALAQNRRVDIVVLSSAADEVRGQLSGLDAAGG